MNDGKLDSELSPVRNPDPYDRRRAVKQAIIAEIARAGYPATWNGSQRIEVLGTDVYLKIDFSQGDKSADQLYVVFDEDTRAKGARKHIREPNRRGFNIQKIAAEIMRRAQHRADHQRRVAQSEQRASISKEIATAMTEDLTLPEGCSLKHCYVAGKVALEISLTIDPILARELLEHAIKAHRQDGRSDVEE